MGSIESVFVFAFGVLVAFGEIWPWLARGWGTLVEEREIVENASRGSPPSEERCFSEIF